MWSLRRRQTRRDELVQRTNDLFARVWWSATSWYGGRRLRGQTRRHLMLWSAIAGGAAVSAALGGSALRKRVGA